jgi:SseB protein C-terminal domain
VLEAMLGGTVLLALVPTAHAPADHPVAAARAPDGTATAYLFSGPGPLALWGATDRVVHGPGRAMAAIVRDQGLTAASVDVAGPVAATLDHAELRALASGVAEPGAPQAPTAARPAPLRLRAPDPALPAEAARALTEALRPREEVRAAYVFEGPPDGERRRLWLGLDLAVGADAGAAIDAGLEALAPHAGGARLAVTVVERDAVLAALREAAPPLYERSGG